jgi:CHRD domain-containing protein
MTRSRMILALATVIGLTMSVGAATAHDNKHRPEVFRAVLLGINETPSIATEGSGRFRAVLDEDEQKLTFTLTYEDLTGEPFMAHIHLGERHTAGGIMVWLCGAAGGRPDCPTTKQAVVTGTITAADVVAITGQGVVAGNFDQLLDALRSGDAYANVHTNPTFKAGEIRGQIFDR